ncbi:uncharacterized protein LOC110893398 [Helianthus annuus]|uniref:uncharacterized protein LOC110893398 n=1 Tax=Helianthus annuus TaxID=4232 RepID=UPI000B906E30|nr:uncharacterized protein LOC110893398 [Helianthus annuus]
MTWGWRKILALRDLVRPFLWKSIGNGANTNVWSDTWCNVCPLRSHISPRAIANAGFNLQSSVAEMIDSSGNWKWPVAWYDLFPVLINLQVPVLHDTQDRLVWINSEGNSCYFSSWEVWNNIRYREHVVSWLHMVWFKQCIPRHSFHLWMVIRNKLKTQDRMSVWEAGSATNLNLMCCPLCYHDRDSRNHLFFECSYAKEIWLSIRDMANMGNVNGRWEDIMLWMDQHSTRQPVNVVSRLVVAAASYFVWQERNSRLFNRNQRSATALSQEIVNTVRLRLLSFKFKQGAVNRNFLQKWNIPSNNLDIDPG